MDVPTCFIPQPVIHGAYNDVNYNSLLRPIQDPLAFGLPLYEAYPRTARDFSGRDWTLLPTQLVQLLCFHAKKTRF